MENKLKFTTERLEGIPCDKVACHYWDKSYEQCCSKSDLNDKPMVGECRGYHPLIDELMTLHQETTPGKWVICGKDKTNIATDDLNVLIQSADGRIFIDIEDIQSIVSLHNSFPDLYREYKVMERMIEKMAEDLGKVYDGEAREAYRVYRGIAIHELKKEGVVDATD